jgi:hypothetical protein
MMNGQPKPKDGAQPEQDGSIIAVTEVIVKAVGVHPNLLKASTAPTESNGVYP